MTGIVDNYRTIDNNRKILTFTYVLQLHVHVRFVVRLIKRINCSNRPLSNRKHQVFSHELLVSAGSVALSLWSI